MSLRRPSSTTLSEVEAHAAFTVLLRHHMPLYVQPALEGVHYGLKVGGGTHPHFIHLIPSWWISA